MHDDQKLVTIADYENEFDAELAKLTLDNAGIESVVMGEDIGAIKPFSTTNYNVELQVFEKDVEKAKQVLAEKAEQGDQEVESNE